MRCLWLSHHSHQHDCTLALSLPCLGWELPQWKPRRILLSLLRFSYSLFQVIRVIFQSFVSYLKLLFLAGGALVFERADVGLRGLDSDPPRMSLLKLLEETLPDGEGSCGGENSGFTCSVFVVVYLDGVDSVPSLVFFFQYSWPSLFLTDGGPSGVGRQRLHLP